MSRPSRRRLHGQRAAAAGLVRGEQPFGVYPAPRRFPRFVVPVGTPCAVRRVFTDAWLPFTTTKDNAFERFERWVTDEGGPYDEFRSEVGGWLLLAAARHVVHRPH
jgi:hypothetical protein